MTSPLEQQRRRREEAEEARRQWEQGITNGRDHNFLQAKWEAYTALAHLAGAFMDIEHQAALEGRAQR